MRLRTSRYVALAGIAALSGIPAACSTTPGVSNGSVSSCYRAIPVGRNALHDPHAELIGIHRVPVDQVRSHLPIAAQNELAAEDDQQVCEMSFRGYFTAGQVDLAPAAQSGQFALVLVSSKRLHLIGSVVLETLPRAFGGRVV